MKLKNPGIIIDFDWSNGKAIWTKSRPMNDEEVLQKQVELSTSSMPVFVNLNSTKIKYF